jgi:HEAT repeat protein
MPRIRDILPAVIALRSKSVDQALSAALAHADADEVGALGLAMLERGKPNAAEALVGAYHRLPTDLQHKVVAEAERFATSIRRAAGGRGDQAALNALAIIENAASTRLAYLVTSMCRHGEARVREQAGRCLVALARRAASSPEPHQQPHLDTLSTRFLIEAVEQAVVLYSRHDQPDVLSAMLWLMPRPMPEALAALRSAEHAATEPLAHRLTADSDTASRRALLGLIAIRPLADACGRALSDANLSQSLGEVLETGHLLAMPAVTRALGRVRRPETLWPDAKQHSAMPTHARRWLPTYLAATTPDTHEQVARLASLSRRTDPPTRLAVLRRLLAIARSRNADDRAAADNANDAIALLTRDPEPAIARTALWHLIQVDYAGLPRILADLVNSRHPAIRRLASKHLAPLGFDRYWDAWPKLDPKRRVAAGRALIKIDGDFHRHLANRLASRDPDKRLRALGIIATLNQGCFFEEVLLDLCACHDERIVASAVKALSGCTSEAAKKTLDLALEHDDARIRANALEAISHSQAAENLDKLLDMAQDQAQRPRANAIKALLELRAKDALPSLTRMLNDQRAQHRISALWLIDELGILHLARLVAEMSLSDEDERVKKRAGVVIQHLIDDLHHQADQPDAPTPADTPTEAA